MNLPPPPPGPTEEHALCVKATSEARRLGVSVPVVPTGRSAQFYFNLRRDLEQKISERSQKRLHVDDYHLAARVTAMEAQLGKLVEQVEENHRLIRELMETSTITQSEDDCAHHNEGVASSNMETWAFIHAFSPHVPFVVVKDWQTACYLSFAYPNQTATKMQKRWGEAVRFYANHELRNVVTPCGWNNEAACVVVKDLLPRAFARADKRALRVFDPVEHDATFRAAYDKAKWDQRIQGEKLEWHVARKNKGHVNAICTDEQWRALETAKGKKDESAEE
jgi:hypothetical protein